MVTNELTLCSKILYLVNKLYTVLTNPTTFPYSEPDGTSRQLSNIEIHFNYRPLLRLCLPCGAIP